MATLLRAAIKRGVAPAYARHLLAGFGTAEPATAQDHPDLIEPLSARELDVLRMLRSDLDGPDIDDPDPGTADDVHGPDHDGGDRPAGDLVDVAGTEIAADGGPTSGAGPALVTEAGGTEAEHG